MGLHNSIIKILIRIVAVIALGFTIVPSILHFTGKIAQDKVVLWMAVGMVLWFITGTLWLGKKTGNG